MPDRLAKSAALLPPSVMLEIFSAALPEFVTRTLCGKLVAPCASDGKFTVPGIKVIAGAAGGAPSPTPLIAAL